MTITDLTLKAIQERNWEGMVLFLTRMNILDFRRIQTTLRTKVMPEMDNDLFWETYLHLITFKKPSFLACIAAAENLIKEGKIDFKNEYVKQISVYLHTNYPDALNSMISIILPSIQTEEQMESLFEAFEFSGRNRLACLLKYGTPLSFYVLFKELKLLQDKELIQKCAVFIMKKNDDMYMNMACILKEYFGLHSLKCTKSLNIEPYELSYIDRNKDTFLNVLSGKRPKV